jgi:hypothetical protein
MTTIGENPFASIAARAGMQMKEPNTSVVLIRQESETIFRAICMEDYPHHEFDIFGKMAPATDAEGECSVIQTCIEHIEKCAGKSKPLQTRVIGNVHEPLWKLVVTWQAAV